MCVCVLMTDGVQGDLASSEANLTETKSLLAKAQADGEAKAQRIESLLLEIANKDETIHNLEAKVRDVLIGRLAGGRDAASDPGGRSAAKEATQHDTGAERQHPCVLPRAAAAAQGERERPHDVLCVQRRPQPGADRSTREERARQIGQERPQVAVLLRQGLHPVRHPERSLRGGTLLRCLSLSLSFSFSS